MSGLKSLSLQNCGVRDISALAGLSGLRELYLDSNRISDLSALSGLTNLSYLYITGNDLTPDQVRQLQSQLPHCSIYTDLDLSEPEPSQEPEAPEGAAE